MRYVIDVQHEGVRVPLSRRRVVEIARSVLAAEHIDSARLSITFVSNQGIATLNRRHLGHRGSTDVISFSLASAAFDEPLLGDIYIAPEVAKKNAAEHGVTLREELTRLVVHGVLHVLGYDHPVTEERQRSKMWRRQEALVMQLSQRARRRGSAPRSAA